MIRDRGFAQSRRFFAACFFAFLSAFFSFIVFAAGFFASFLDRCSLAMRVASLEKVVVIMHERREGWHDRRAAR